MSKNDDHVSIQMVVLEINYSFMKESLQQSKSQRLILYRYIPFFFIQNFSKTFRSKLNDSQTTTPTIIGKKTVTIPGISSSSTGTKSTPTTPVERSPPLVLMRTRSPNKLNPAVVVVPRQTSEHSKQGTHVTARPNSMI